MALGAGRSSPWPPGPAPPPPCMPSLALQGTCLGHVCPSPLPAGRECTAWGTCPGVSCSFWPQLRGGRGGRDGGCTLEPRSPLSAAPGRRRPPGGQPSQTPRTHGPDSDVLLPTVYSGPEQVTSDMQFSGTHGRVTHAADQRGQPAAPRARPDPGNAVQGRPRGTCCADGPQTQAWGKGE